LVKLLLGLVKGLVIGGALGYGAYALGLDGGFNWVTYGLVGAFVGLLVGRPIWSHVLDRSSTSWVSVLKALFGFGVGCGIYALVAKVWGGAAVALNGESRLVQDWQPLFGGALGAVYGAFVELDDASDDKAKAKDGKDAKAEKPATPPAKKK
jgi:hypothetical protein